MVHHFGMACRPGDDTLVRVRTYLNAFESDLAKSALDDAGIECLVRATQTFNLSGSRPPGGISFSLESLAPPVKIEAGDYTLTFIADSACADRPNDVRTRTYAATITPAPTLPANTRLLVTVSGPFLSSFGFGVGVAGNSLGFVIDGPAFFEHFPPFTYLEIAGAGGGVRGDINPLHDLSSFQWRG